MAYNGCPLSRTNTQHAVSHAQGDPLATANGGQQPENQPANVVNVKQKPGSLRSPSTLLFEQSVADFSDCPQVLGLSPVDADLILADAELSEDALEFNYPEIRLESSNFVRLRPQKIVGKINKAVPRIVERNDAGLENSMDSSVKDYR